MIKVRSSWIVEDGFARPIDAPAEEPRRYRCSRCGEHGHSITTCGLTDEQRQERRR